MNNSELVHETQPLFIQNPLELDQIPKLTSASSTELKVYMANISSRYLNIF